MKYKDRFETIEAIELKAFIDEEEQTVTVKFPLILSRCRKLYQQLNSLP
jgi:hypothetical protein